MPEPSMLQVVLMGLITVFIALICLIIIIVILGKIMVAVTGNKTVETTQAPAPAPCRPLPRLPRPRSLATSRWWLPLRPPLRRTWARMWTTSGSCPSAGCNTHGKENGNPKVYLEQRGNQL